MNILILGANGGVGSKFTDILAKKRQILQQV